MGVNDINQTMMNPENKGFDESYPRFCNKHEDLLEWT